MYSLTEREPVQVLKDGGDVVSGAGVGEEDGVMWSLEPVQVLKDGVMWSLERVWVRRTG